MGAVRDEQEAGGDIDSVEDADEIKQSTLSTEESICERLSVLVKIEDDVYHVVKDSERNMYHLEGLESGT
jgi:ribosomal silencing factor RsfS